MRHYARTAVLLLASFTFLLGPATLSQTATPSVAELDAIGPAFEVATIRPAADGDHRSWFGMKCDNSGRFRASAVPLETLVYAAYATTSHSQRVEVDHAAPKWITSDQFDIEARVDDAYLTGWNSLLYSQRMDIVRPMLRRLLVERFRVKLSVETRVTPVYALVQAKGGAHVKEVLPPPFSNEDAADDKSQWMIKHPGEALPGLILCTGDKCIARAVKITDALGQIAANSHADRMVIDGTNLAGFYDFSFSFPNEKVEFPMQEVENDLGMKFASRSVPITTYVIRSAEKPGID